MIGTPSIILHFVEADVELGTRNLFVNKGESLHCFTFVPGEKMTFGGYAQGDFLVGYNLRLNVLSFKRNCCPDHL